MYLSQLTLLSGKSVACQPAYHAVDTISNVGLNPGIPASALPEKSNAAPTTELSILTTGSEKKSGKEKRERRMWRVLLLLPLILKDMLHFMRQRQISGCGVLGLQRAAIKRSARATNGARAARRLHHLPASQPALSNYSQINRGRSTRHERARWCIQEERRLRFVVRYSHEGCQQIGGSSYSFRCDATCASLTNTLMQAGDHQSMMRYARI